MNHNHPSVKFTVQKVQSCVGVKNQFHKVQLLKSFLMLFSVLYKLLEYTFVFSRDLVTNHYLVVAEFGFCTNYVVRSPGTNLGSARNWAWSISAEDVWRTPQQEIVWKRTWATWTNVWASCIPPSKWLFMSYLPWISGRLIISIFQCVHLALTRWGCLCQCPVLRVASSRCLGKNRGRQASSNSVSCHQQYLSQGPTNLNNSI